MRHHFRHEMNRHTVKLTAKAKECEVWFLSNRPDVMKVKSPSGETYYVQILTAGTDERHVEYRCSCQFCARYANDDRACSHKIAAEMKLNRDFGQYTSFWANKVDARRQHRMIVEIQDIWATIRKS